VRRQLAAVAAISAFLVLFAQPASAHSEPEIVTPQACSSTPTAGDIVINLSAEADVEATNVVASVSGVAVASAGVDLTDLDHRRVVVSLPKGTTGRVDVAWSTRSAADGDDASGSYAFVVGGDAELSNCGLAAESDTASGTSFALVALIGGSALVAIALVRNRRHAAAVPG